MTTDENDNTGPEVELFDAWVNKNYGGKLHRDAGNIGPSLLRALGDVKGGELHYGPYDNTKRPLHTLKESGRVMPDIRENIVVFDGRRRHEVADFEGERYSLVYFSCGEHNTMRPDD